MRLMADQTDARKYLESVLPKGQWKAASLAIGHDHAYIQQYIRQGKPGWLKERDREALVALYGLDGARLRPPPKTLTAARVEKSEANRHHQTQINAQRSGKPTDDPRTIQLLSIWARIERDDDRDMALVILTALADKVANPGPGAMVA